MPIKRLYAILGAGLLAAAAPPPHAAAPPTAAAGPEVSLVMTKVLVIPDTPRAGRPFTASVRVVRRDTGATVGVGVVQCSARLGRSKLTLLARGFRTRRALCRWKLPSSAGGRAIVGSIRVVALGAAARRFFGRPVL